MRASLAAADAPEPPPGQHVWTAGQRHGSGFMNNIVWLVGAVVIVLAILSFFGLR